MLYKVLILKNVEEDVAELLNPKKSYGQVFDESTIGHDLYVKSHNSYYASEQVNRKYFYLPFALDFLYLLLINFRYKPPFNINNVFGLPVSVNDVRGCLARDCVTSKSNNKFTNTCVVQADFQARKKPKLGQNSAMYDNSSQIIIKDIISFFQ